MLGGARSARGQARSFGASLRLPTTLGTAVEIAADVTSGGDRGLCANGARGQARVFGAALGGGTWRERRGTSDEVSSNRSRRCGGSAALTWRTAMAPALANRVRGQAQPFGAARRRRRPGAVILRRMRGEARGGSDMRQPRSHPSPQWLGGAGRATRQSR